MPELLLELFSEEIPARMQVRAAEDLARLVADALAPLAPGELVRFSGPRRIALAATVAASVAATSSSERGPRVNAPEQALAGFLRKHGATRDEIRQDGDFHVLDKQVPGITAQDLIARELPGLLRRFPWPKSMRWGGTSGFTWVRPLRRILCILDGAVVPFDLRDGSDDGHGLVSGNVTEGHRFLAAEPFAVASAAEWQRDLRARYVIADAAERRALVEQGVRDIAAGQGVSVVPDAGLLDEVAGLVEWPVPLLGRIDPSYMDLPPEVMQVSMRVNQRYFALRDAQGQPAPRFAFVANIEATDGGAAIVAGNERVLRARFADARHFWDLDRKQMLASRVPALDAVTFHARLGSQGQRARRLEMLAKLLAEKVGADPGLAGRAGLLAKADLVTGMVGEFPELQGVMGSYYARQEEGDAVADAIRDHYAPRGPTDEVPAQPVSIAVALADKIDLLAGFFGIGEKPTGSGDPYALRRAALGIIRIVREHSLRLGFIELTELALKEVYATIDSARESSGRAGTLGLQFVGRAVVTGPIPGSNRFVDTVAIELLTFLAERLRVQLRAEGERHDVLAAVLGTGMDDDLTRLLARTDAVAALLGTDDGVNLLAAYRRAANIVRIEEKKDGPHDGPIDPAALELPEEIALADGLERVSTEGSRLLADEDFAGAMAALATLRPLLDAFFERVTVNDSRAELRRNRLRLLSRVQAAMDQVAKFSRIDG
jgi:glycyl-tRNA synthetase beta chain